MSSTATLYGDEVDTVEEKLAKARVVHKKAFETIQGEIRPLIESKIQAEQNRKNPDLTKIEVLQNELRSLETGVFPSWIEQKHKKAIGNANKALVDVFKEMKATYARSNDLEKAKKIEKEMKDLSGGQTNFKQLPPFQDPALWSRHASKTIRECTEISEIRKRLAAIKYVGPIIVYQHDNRGGLKYHCFITSGGVVRHDDGNSTWAMQNKIFMMKNTSADGSWETRFSFDQSMESFDAVNQNDVRSNGKLIYGDPKSFFNVK